MIHFWHEPYGWYFGDPDSESSADVQGPFRTWDELILAWCARVDD